MGVCGAFSFVASSLSILILGLDFPSMQAPSMTIVLAFLMLGISYMVSSRIFSKWSEGRGRRFFV